MQSRKGTNKPMPLQLHPRWLEWLFRQSFMLSLTLFLLAQSAQNACALEVGDIAPPLVVSEWVVGEPVTLAELKGRAICVVDLLATWNPSCLGLLQERSELQRQYADRGVVFIGIAVQPAWQVRQTVSEVRGTLNWRIAADSAQRTFASYTGAERLPTVPFAAVIDRDGTVVWLGNPRGELAQVLNAVVGGSWDADLARQRYINDRNFWEFNKQLEIARNSGCTAFAAEAERTSRLPMSKAGAYMRAPVLAGAAYFLLSSDKCSGEYTEAAFRLAKQAAEDDPKGGFYLIPRAYARALAETHDLTQAIEYQIKAIKVVKTPEIRDTLRVELRQYADSFRRETGKNAEIPPEVFSDTPKAEKPTSTPVRPPETISRDDAIADLKSLQEYMLLNYAGYDDISWKLSQKGTSWEDRTDAWIDKLDQRPSWPIEEFFDTLRSYLEVVEDAHFSLVLPADTAGSSRRRATLVTKYVTYFTGLRIVRKGATFTVQSVSDGRDDLFGLEVRGIAQASAISAQLDTAYLFPTIAGNPAVPEYLLGVFRVSQPANQPIAPLHLRLWKADRPVDVELELHRSRVMDTVSTAKVPWEFITSPGIPIPVFRVRSCESDGVSDQFLPSALRLRSEGAFVLDLRRNLGGEDPLIEEWCKTLSDQEYSSRPNVMFQCGVRPPANRWGICSLGKIRTGADSVSSGRPYSGRILVVVDRNVASSGETFVSLIRHIPGAVLLGENTSGCTTYGNLEMKHYLPHSGIRVRFGWVKYNMADLYPIREGVGFFPDLWLDTPDVYTEAAKLLAQ